MMATSSRIRWTVLIAVFLAIGVPTLAGEGAATQLVPQKRITLRAAGVPESYGTDVEALARLAIMEAFQKRFPHIVPVASTGLQIPGKTMDMLPLMQIAGDIAADVMYVNFRQSQTYVSQKFLYPLEEYIEQMVGLPEGIPDRHLLTTEQYVEALKAGPHFKREIEGRVPSQCWEVMRRSCPFGLECPYLKEQGLKACKDHYHVWAFPEGPCVMAMFYRKDLFAEAGLPDRVPDDLDEMFEWGKKLTDPKRHRSGFMIYSELSWATLGILYSMGGKVVEQEARVHCDGCRREGYRRRGELACEKCGQKGVKVVPGDRMGAWYCAFDSDEAVEAYFFVSRMLLEPFKTVSGDKAVGMAYISPDGSIPAELQPGMQFDYLNQKTFQQINPAVTGFGPVPVFQLRDKDGRALRDAEGKALTRRGSEFNSEMFGIYAGIEDKARRDAAWEYVRFYDGPEANRIRATTFVENGQAQYVRPALLRQCGFGEYITPRHEAWEQAYQSAVQDGVPEPYGKNCQLVYTYVTRALSTIRADEEVKDLFEQRYDAMERESAVTTDAARDSAHADVVALEATIKARIRTILHEAVVRSNEKMLRVLSDKPMMMGVFPNEQAMRNTVATIVAAAIFVAFVFVFRKVFKVFRLVSPVIGAKKDQSEWEFGRYKWAYLLMLPALLSIGLWAYWPLIRGTIIAFQDYNVRGFSTWVGMENFANVLFDEEFWHAMWVAAKFTLLAMVFGFGAPIFLAFLLTEVPKGKIVYRTIYYLPAILTGVIVIFLWKGFYDSAGMINQILNYGVAVLNWAGAAMNGWFHWWDKWEAIRPFAQDWLQNKNLALFCCLLPTIWGGMGPGCLIYLAALKTVPEEIYEAADIDGAGTWHKVWHVAIPSIRALIQINFIGALIGAMKTGGELFLVMTQGGPYAPYGETEPVGLHIWYEAYSYLRFGAATAMAWVLGSLLIGFTVYQLQRLSRMEFKTAGGAK